MLEALHFPEAFRELVMECVTTPKFYIMINGVMRGFFSSARGLRQGDPISLFLFVLCMEYLSRILNEMGELQQFNYHPRCKDIRLTHMCFADDLVMCCKGEYASVYLLLRAFKLFSSSTGLQANVSKSAIYTCGMNVRERQRIVDVSGFSHQHLPFKYLGVPICAKRISNTQCEVLIEKMTARIRLWSSRNLSYTARTQLVQSVLLSIHQYWAQIFVLPQQVLKKITQICRDFLWSGQYFTLKSGYIAWEKVCTPKNEGGLGFRDVTKWNIACMVRKVYDTLVGEHPKVHWAGIIWNRLSLPKHRFISWLAFQERLQTTSRLAAMGITNQDNCLLCAMQKEDHYHLFFQCPYSKGCLQAFKEWLSITTSTTDLKLLIRWIQRSRKSKFQKNVMYAGITGLIYKIWQSRNKVFWEMCAPNIDASCKQLKNIVKPRVRVVLP
ncbi:uncharacterized protein LOC109134420 [Beta vulgaris subsp. vulgaris]|uniref:uncharacterized protein LOC109134420 n=1 Tax=Beta vulgaris subsp. vulgaris TaxID=3555 RepID=UPI00203688B0|nr:uncharacterized protein LOC109134420 [Beta vulgaris subsp. vulgaris]